MIEWNTYVNFVAKQAGKPFSYYQYFSDNSKRNVVEDFGMDMAELAALKVFSGVVFGQKDFFFVKRLNPSLSPRLPMKIPHPSEEEVARAKVW